MLGGIKNVSRWLASKCLQVTRLVLEAPSRQVCDNTKAFWIEQWKGQVGLLVWQQ